MFMDSQAKFITQPIRTQLNTVFTPIYFLLNMPSRLTQWGAENLVSEGNLRAENQSLKEQLLALNGRLQKFSELSADNSRLRGLIDSTVAIDGRMLIAEVMGVDADPFRQIVMINKGSNEGLYIGQTVLDEKGVVGQVIEVAPDISRVMLIADREHVIPVRVQRNGIRTLVAGTGDLNALSIQYLPESADVKVDDVLMSSGLGQRYPAGYPVAKVVSIKKHGTNEFAEVWVKPIAQLDRTRYVLLLFLPHKEIDVKGGQSDVPK